MVFRISRACRITTACNVTSLVMQRGALNLRPREHLDALPASPDVAQRGRRTQLDGVSDQERLKGRRDMHGSGGTKSFADIVPL